MRMRMNEIKGGEWRMEKWEMGIEKVWLLMGIGGLRGSEQLPGGAWWEHEHPPPPQSKNKE